MREATAGRAIDIETCEIGKWEAYDADPYGYQELHPEMQQIGTNCFVRSPESRGWVCRIAAELNHDDAAGGARYPLRYPGDFSGSEMTASLDRNSLTY